MGSHCRRQGPIIDAVVTLGADWGIRGLMVRLNSTWPRGETSMPRSMDGAAAPPPPFPHSNGRPMAGTHFCGGSGGALEGRGGPATVAPAPPTSTRPRPLSRPPSASVTKTFTCGNIKFTVGQNDLGHFCYTNSLPPPPPLCDIPSGCCSFTGPWPVTRSSLRMLRRVAAFCRPLRPVLLPASFPRSRSPVVGVLGLC